MRFTSLTSHIFYFRSGWDDGARQTLWMHRTDGRDHGSLVTKLDSPDFRILNLNVQHLICIMIDCNLRGAVRAPAQFAVGIDTVNFAPPLTSRAQG